MSLSVKLLVLLSFLLIPFMFFPVYAQSSDISATTNKSAYQPGDKVIITGSVQTIVDDNPVTIIVRNPMGNVYDVGQVKLLNNLFVHDFVLNDNSDGGIYTVNIKHGTQSTQIQFIVNAGQLILVPVIDPQTLQQASEIKVRTNGTNPIKYGNVAVSIIDNSIKIPMNATGMTTKSINQQYQVPKSVIDSPGSQLVVKIDGSAIPCTQTETPTVRILDCIVQSTSKELELFGTFIIPEFGSLAGAIVVISLIMAVIITKRSKIHF